MFHKMSNYFHLGLHLLHFFSQILRLSNIRAGLTFAFNLKRQRGISATGFPLFALIKLENIFHQHQNPPGFHGWRLVLGHCPIFNQMAIFHLDLTYLTKKTQHYCGWIKSSFNTTSRL